jgi:hypothetical protein
MDHLYGMKDPIYQAVFVYVTHLYHHFYANNTHHEVIYPLDTTVV